MLPPHYSPFEMPQRFATIDPEHHQQSNNTLLNESRRVPSLKLKQKQSSVLEIADLVSKEESHRFTQSQMNEPDKFIDKLERRVAVLEKMEGSKRK